MGAATLDSFRDFLSRNHIFADIELPVDTSEQWIVCRSGAKAHFVNQMLLALQLCQRDADDNRPPPIQLENEPDLSKTRNMVLQAEEAYRAGLTSAAMLQLWAAFESAMRRAAARTGFSGKSRTQPALLIRHLFEVGFFSAAERQLAEDLRQQRSLLAHGLNVDEPHAPSFAGLHKLTDDTLRRLP